MTANVENTHEQDRCNRRKVGLVITDIDDYVGAFPGVGACVANPPSIDAVGRFADVPFENVAHWSASLRELGVLFGCDDCRSMLVCHGGDDNPTPLCADG